MAYNHSYTITLSNNLSEKEGLAFVVNSDLNFIHPDNKSRKLILEMLEIDSRFYRAFDLVLIPGHTNLEKVIQLEKKEHLVLIELKTTKKELPDNPKGFFFGATKNEFELAALLGENYKFCFVSLHPNTTGYSLLSLEELNQIIKRKRVQYQINL